MNYLRACLSLFILIACASAQANDDEWWFDIEVILFDRNQSLTQLREQFEYVESLAPVHADYDLLGNWLSPDIRRVKNALPACDAPPFELWQAPMSLEDILVRYAIEEEPEALVDDALEIEQDDPIEALISQVTPENDYSTTDMPLEQNSDELNQSDELTEDETVKIDDRRIVALWQGFHADFAQFNVTVDAPQYCQTDTLSQWLTTPQLPLHITDNSVRPPDSVPLIPEGLAFKRAPHPHLLPSYERGLTDLSKRIRSERGLTRLLHLSWRQDVKFGRDEAASFRLIAGKNYGQEFDLDGNQLQPSSFESSLVADDETQVDETEELNPWSNLIEQLEAPGTVSFEDMMNASPLMSEQTSLSVKNDIPIWQIDGYMRVFLRYINRVPYLHIDSELFYRQPIPAEDDMPITNADGQQTSSPKMRLVSVPFKQLRRVISKQIHYFDHPLFGMVVTIRRHHRPSPDDEDVGQE